MLQRESEDGAGPLRASGTSLPHRRQLAGCDARNNRTEKEREGLERVLVSEILSEIQRAREGELTCLMMGSAAAACTGVLGCSNGLSSWLNWMLRCSVLIRVSKERRS